MGYVPLIIIGILVLIIFALIAKIYFMRKSAQEISCAFLDRLTADTNTLIDISTRDKYMRKLAADINRQLRILRKERRRFQQGDMELKEAVTNISHDLRTPLTAINGYLDLLECEEKNENVQRYLAQIRNRTEALKSLTEELFRYSVIRAEEELYPEKLNLCRVLEDNLLSFYGVLQEKGIVPQISLPEEPVWRMLDKAALNRIFSNIINNAVKYSDGDLAVTLTTDGLITFSNTAKALTSVEVGRLFDRFYTVEVSRNSSGLGLSIARLLVERMGGSIEAVYINGKLQIKISFSE